MNYVLKPSLEQSALVQTAATLWNQADVKDLLAKFDIPSKFDEFKSKWVKIEAIAVKKVAQLPLPKQMKEELLCIIRPIGFRISKWRQFHHRGCNLKVDLPKEFFWTPQGTIDEKKTAEVMIKDESIDTATRYKLACIFCLEDDIPKLWDKLSEDCRKSFYDQEDPMNVKQKELVVLWTYQIKGEVDKMESMIEKRMERKCSPHQYAFELAAIDGNRVAAEYFLQKLTSAEREESLVKTAKCVAKGRIYNRDERTEFLKEIYSDMLCFLLSQLDQEQQLEVIKSHPMQVLTCLLDWPWQSFFTETANRMWGHIDKLTYQFVFIHFTGNVIQGYKDFNYQKLFREYWENSPPDYKRHILSDSIFNRIVAELFETKDEDNIKLVFKDATPHHKSGVIHSEDGLDICKKFISKSQMRLLRYFIKECLPSKQDVEEFKDYFEEFHTNEFLMKNWQHKLIAVLDEIICEFKKRKSAEGECSKTKKM